MIGWGDGCSSIGRNYCRDAQSTLPEAEEVIPAGLVAVAASPMDHSLAQYLQAAYQTVRRHFVEASNSLDSSVVVIEFHHSRTLDVVARSDLPSVICSPLRKSRRQSPAPHQGTFPFHWDTATALCLPSEESRQVAARHACSICSYRSLAVDRLVNSSRKPFVLSAPAGLVHRCLLRRPPRSPET